MRTIKYCEEAHEDVLRLNEYIAQECHMPLTAKRYMMGLEQRILWLQQNADLFPVIPELSFEMGFPVRRLNYEKMAVLYSMTEDVVYVHRIIPQSMIY